MKRRTRAWSILLLALLLSGAHAAVTEAAARNIQTSGIATGGGRATIIIESFGQIAGPRPGAQTAFVPIYNISVTIPSGSTAPNTTIMIRDSADFVLPGDYTVTIPVANVVSIVRTGDFSMSISENVPGQTITELFTTLLPIMGPAGSTALVMLLVASGALFLARRRRDEPS